jgi:hypothetical protein
MRPGLEEWFELETSALRDKSVAYSVRFTKWLRLIHDQEGVVRLHTNGSIVSPIDPVETEDAKEYLERLRKFVIAP